MSDTSVLQQSREMSAAELRKINKPLVEKRRRSRINNCLETLKTLILDATKKDTIRYSKLEKADILEMTVKYLRDLSGGSQQTTASKYHAGFNECATEVTRFLAKDESLTPDMRLSLLNHLAGRLQNVNTLVNNQQRVQASSTSSSVGYHHQQQYHNHHHQYHPYTQVPTATSLSHLPGFNRNASATVSNPAYQQASMMQTTHSQVPMFAPMDYYSGLTDNTPMKSSSLLKESPIMASTPLSSQTKSIDDYYKSHENVRNDQSFQSGSMSLIHTDSLKYEDVSDDEVSMEISREKSALSYQTASSSSIAHTSISEMSCSALSKMSTSNEISSAQTSSTSDFLTSSNVELSSVSHDDINLSHNEADDVSLSHNEADDVNLDQNEANDVNLDHNGNDENVPNFNLQQHNTTTTTDQSTSFTNSVVDESKVNEHELSYKSWSVERDHPDLCPVSINQNCANQVVPNNEDDESMWRPW